MRFGRLAVCVFTASLFYGAFAMGQVDGLHSYSASSTVVSVPRLIRTNGSIHDETGKPLTGTLGITFTLYSDPDGQSPVWQEYQKVHLDSSGRYSALLGATSDVGLPLEIFSGGEARWLGVRAEGHSEQPRIFFLSVAYALKAADSDMLGGKPASAFVLAENVNSSAQQANSAQPLSRNSQSAPRVLDARTPPLLMAPTVFCSIGTDGSGTANQIAKFSDNCDIVSSAIFESGGNVGIGNTSPAGTLDVSGTAYIRGLFTAMGGTVIAPSGTATASQGYISSPLDIQTSLFNTILGRAANYTFRWQAEPVGNDTTSTSATLNLLYGVTGNISETGISVNNKGILTFAPNQTFPGTGTGTVTSVNTGAGLTGGPVTGSGTISIPSNAVTNAMLANNSVTVQAGSGLSGGGTVALGGTITLSNASPSSGGTVTNISSGTGLSGGPITTSGTLSLNTGYTDARYLQLSGGSLTGGLNGTTAAFTGGLSAASGTFSSTLSAAGALLPKTGTATTTQGFISNPFDLQASSFNSSSSAAIPQDFRWQAEPTGNNSPSPSGSLNLLFGSNGNSPNETGLSIASNGVISFASGQTFPGASSGTVMGINTGAGLTGGPITTTGTISIPSAGVTNAMLANNSVTVQAGPGLSGGGTVALGGTLTITNASPSSGGTLTSISSGTGLSGGPITTSGTLSLNTGYTDARYLQLSGGSLTGGLNGTTAAFTGGLSAASGTFSSTLSAAGALLPKTGTATTTQGFTSNPFDLQASSFSSGSSSAMPQLFRWQAEPTGNNSSNPSGSLNLLFGSNGNAPSETGLSIASNGLITFASGQTFPGTNNGTVTGINTGAGLTGGPITTTGTISIPSAGVTNDLLANPFVTVQAGPGLSGGGTVALGGTVTITNASPSSGGTVTSISSGTGLTGGPITTSGTLNLDTNFTDARYLQLAGGTLAGGLSGTTATFTSTLSAAGALLPGTGSATATQGFISNPFDLQASAFNSDSSSAIPQDFRWQAEPTGNNSSNPSGSLNLLFGSNGNTPTETGLFIASNGVINFASGQTFPGTNNGTVTGINTGAGLTGGPITTSGTISIPSAGVTNDLLANPFVTVQAGPGLSGGGTVALGGTVTITNASPSSGGTVTSVSSGTGLMGGPITTTGTLDLDTNFTDARYLQLSGGTLTGGLSGTSASFTSTLSAAGALLPVTDTATAAQGFTSNPLDLQASAFNSDSSLAITQLFRWQAEPTGNNSSNPSGSLNLLFASTGNSPAETGLSIASNGLITFAPGQTFPSADGGTVTTVNTGAGLTGGPITSSGTISIRSAGVTNDLLANPFVTVQAGPGLSGGGTVALGGTITLTNASPSSGGTVTSINSGTGLTGGPITSSGTLNLDTNFTDARYLQVSGGTLTGSLSGTTASFTSGTFSSTLSAAGALLPGIGTATATQGFSSNPFDLQASSFNSSSSSGVTQDFRWQAEPTRNNSSNPSGSLNLLFGSNGNTPSETGLSIASNGVISFAPAQTFPGNSGGSVTSINTGAGLTGGPITGSGMISILSSGVTNDLLANPFVTVQAGPGLSGGGMVALGGTITLTNASPSSGGTVTSINTGAGLTGGPISGSGTISIPSGGVTNSMLADPFVTVQAGPGLSGGGTAGLGGAVTLSANLSGSTEGMAYFSSPTSVISTPAPTNGQILIGSTGGAPVLGTLTAGSNINITNKPGSITISTTGGTAPTLPYFVTGGPQIGAFQGFSQNVTELWGFLLPYNVTTTQITYDVTTADNSPNDYDIGIFDNSGNLVVNIGPTPGTTFAPSKAFHTAAWTQGSTSLPAGRYYLGLTTNCSITLSSMLRNRPAFQSASSCAQLAASAAYMGFAINASAGASHGGTLPSSITPPVDNWGTGAQPAVVIR